MLKKLTSMFLVVMLVALTSTTALAETYCESSSLADSMSAESDAGEEISLYSFTQLTSASGVLDPFGYKTYTFNNPTSRYVKIYALGGNVDDSNGNGIVTIGNHTIEYNNYSESPHTIYLPKGNISYEVRSYSGATTTYAVIIGY